VRIGQTQHFYIIMHFSKELEISTKMNLSPKEIESRYKDLEPVVEGIAYDVISRLLKSILNLSIIVSTDFKTSTQKEGIKCSVKAQEGYLFPLRRALLFLHKPVSYIRHEDIHYAEFARVSEFTAHNSRSFDLSLVTKKGDAITFSGVEKAEYGTMLGYFKDRGVKVKAMSEEEGEGEGEVEKPVAGEEEEYDDEEDDEDFVVGEHVEEESEGEVVESE
jgi:structure-specific recognition protein 1